MPFVPPVNPNSKKVTWLELYFDLIFALALAMSAKPLEHFQDFSWASFLHLGQFLLIFFFLIMFWYRHMQLVNRFEHSSFVFAFITLFIGFIVIAFTQFLRIWTFDDVLGSWLATITMSIAVLSLAGLYYISSLNFFGGEAQAEKTWAKAASKHMLWEAAAYLIVLLLDESIRPFGLILIFIYFNRYPFETYLNPKKQSTMDPALTTLPAERTPHKTERMGLFSLLVYGLVIVLAATPLLDITEKTVTAEVLGPVIIFGKVFMFISLIWYFHYRLIEIVKPKGNQFVVMTFISLSLLVATTHFIRIMLMIPSNFSEIMFSLSTGILLSIMATQYWNAKTIAGAPPTETLLIAFKQWSYLLYSSATAFFVSIVFPGSIRIIIWKSVIIIALLVLIFDNRLNLYYTKSMDAKKNRKFLDNQTVTGLTVSFVGVISFFVVTALLEKPIISGWILFWIIPLFVGFFIILNHWLHTRIKPN